MIEEAVVNESSCCNECPAKSHREARKDQTRAMHSELT